MAPGPEPAVEAAREAAAAERAGAQLFLVPDNDVDEAPAAEVPVRGVQNLQQALDMLTAA